MKKRIGLSIFLIALISGCVLFAFYFKNEQEKELTDNVDISEHFFYVKDTLLIEHSTIKRYWLFASDSLMKEWLKYAYEYWLEANIDILYDPIPPIIEKGPDTFFWLRPCNHNNECNISYLEFYQPRLKSIGLSLGIEPIYNEWGRLDDLAVVDKFILPILTEGKYRIVDHGNLSIGGGVTFSYAKISITNIRDQICVITTESKEDAFIIDHYFRFNIPINIKGIEYDVFRGNRGLSNLYLLTERYK
jgi:hypothetical protein